MVWKRTILNATVLALFAGVAGAETMRAPASSEVPPLKAHVVRSSPRLAATAWLDEYTFAAVEQPSRRSGESDSTNFFAGNFDTSALSEHPNSKSCQSTSPIDADLQNPFKKWLSPQITTDSEPAVSHVISQVGAVAYCSDSYPLYRHTESPPSSHGSRAYRGTPYGLALRGGWWDIQTDGSKTKTGEFQSLQSSEFWDADGLYTDGKKTIDFSASGLDSEATDASLRYFGPRVSADVEYQRFLRRLDHDPLAGMADVKQQPPGGAFIIKEDLNTGEDYAIRVQELKVNFKGDLTKNLKWRLGIWGMRKQGERQVNAMGHCFSHPDGMDSNGNPIAGTSCHVLTQQQKIDWVTTEIEPAIEATFAAASFEYVRTMRAFDQSDQVTTRDYNSFGFGSDLPYAVVPENFTEIDRVRANVLLLPGWDVYSQYYNGNTRNKFRDTNRRLWGYDVRSTVRPSGGVSLTGFAKKNVQTGQLPTVLLPEENITDLRAPIDYDQTTAGIKGRWRPFYGDYSWRRGLRLSGGYEYRGLARTNAVFTEGAVTVDQSQTTANLANIRAAMRWHPAIESHVRYRLGFVDDPLYGIAKNAETNSSRPTEQHLIEIGGTWTPADNFLLTGTFGFEDRSNTSAVSYFQENDYPIVVTAWYAPEPRWTFSGGLAFFSNWIDQDIKLGAGSDTLTSSWNYRGRSDVINLGSTYAWSDRLTLSGGFEFVRGSNGFASPALPYDLSQYSDVLVETVRWTTGLDYQLLSGWDLFFRYQFFDYEDKTQSINSGTANMVLAGINAIF